jgi:branched-chain amino acid transport system permease protein
METTAKWPAAQADAESKAAVPPLNKPRKAVWGEVLFWGVAVLAPLLVPSKQLLLNEIAILGLFALSLDLILGYAGIVSLGHAAFFGVGGYTAGLLAKHYTGDPLTGLLAAGAVAGALGWVASFLVLRGSDLARLMVTLGVALLLFELANSMAWLTGGADGLQGIDIKPVLGLFDFDLGGRVAYAYSLSVSFVLFLIARLVTGSPFGLSLKAIRDNRLRASATGVPVNARLSAVYAWAAAYAGIAGGLLVQTTQFISLDYLDFHRSADVLLVLIIGGTGYLYGGLLGAIAFGLAHNWLSDLSPQYWQFWIGLFLVFYVLSGRDRLTALITRLRGGSRPGLGQGGGQ